MNIIFNTDNDEIIKERHVAFKVTVCTEFGKREFLRLCEIVERTYRHPEAKEFAFITNYEYVVRKEVNRYTSEAAALELFLNADINIQNNSLL